MTPILTDKTTKAQSILERSAVLVLRITRLGTARKVDTDLLGISKDGEQLEEEKKALSIQRQLVSRADLHECHNILSAAAADVKALSLHGHRVFGDGTYIVPLQNVEQAESRLEARCEELQAAIARVLAPSEEDPSRTNWDLIVERNRKRLGKLAADAEFPTADDVKAEFTLDWSYVSFGAPEHLVEVSQLAHERAVAKEQARFAAAYDEVVLGLRSAALKVLTEFAERLAPGKDGKPKAIRGTALNDLRELLDQLPVLNMADDDELAEIMAKVNALTAGINVETLKSAPAVRALVQAEAEKAAALVQALVSDAERGFRFTPKK